VVTVVEVFVEVVAVTYADGDELGVVIGAAELPVEVYVVVVDDGAVLV
jgi:hypothetical protein